MDAEVLEFIVKPRSKITNKLIRDLKFPKDAIIGGVVRGENSYVTMGDFRIEPRDRVVVFSMPEAIHEVEGFFK
jgi:trk system potassium uptake protein TrkA